MTTIGDYTQQQNAKENDTIRQYRSEKRAGIRKTALGTALFLGTCATYLVNESIKNQSYHAVPGYTVYQDATIKVKQLDARIDNLSKKDLLEEIANDSPESNITKSRTLINDYRAAVKERDRIFDENRVKIVAVENEKKKDYSLPLGIFALALSYGFMNKGFESAITASGKIKKLKRDSSRLH